MAMANEIRVNFDSPANASVLNYLHVDPQGEPATYLPTDVNWFQLDTHPDFVEYFWKLADALEAKCACAITQTGNPLLVHPTSGIIFGMAGGTSTLAFRLPEAERSSVLAIPGYGAEYKYPHSTIYAKDLGQDWVLVKPYTKDNAALCKAAFTYAGTLG